MEELPEVDPAIWADLRLPLPNQKILNPSLSFKLDTKTPQNL